MSCLRPYILAGLSVLILLYARFEVKPRKIAAIAMRERISLFRGGSYLDDADRKPTVTITNLPPPKETEESQTIPQVKNEGILTLNVTKDLKAKMISPENLVKMLKKEYFPEEDPVKRDMFWDSNMYDDVIHQEKEIQKGKLNASEIQTKLDKEIYDRLSVSKRFEEHPSGRVIVNNKTGYLGIPSRDIMPPIHGISSDNLGKLGRKLQRQMDPRTFWELVVTVVGPGLESKSLKDGKGSSAMFRTVTNMAADDIGNLYFVDTLSRQIRKLDVEKLEVTTLAGKDWEQETCEDGWAPIPKKKDGHGTKAIFGNIFGITVARDQSVVVTDNIHHVIRRIVPNGEVTTIAGSGRQGKRDGRPKESSFRSPTGIATDPVTGNIYVSDTGNNLIRKISVSKNSTSEGMDVEDVTTFAGGGTVKQLVPTPMPTYLGALRRSKPKKVKSSELSPEPDGYGSSAAFWLPFALTVSKKGVVYVGEVMRYSIRQISPEGEVTTLVRQESWSGPMFTMPDNENVQGRRKRNYEGYRFDIAVDPEDNVYWTDRWDSVIRKINPASGVISIYSGSAEDRRTSIDGYLAHATFNCPAALAFDVSGKGQPNKYATALAREKGQLYIAEAWGHRIRRVEWQPITDFRFRRAVRSERNRVLETYKYLMDGTEYDPESLPANRFAANEIVFGRHRSLEELEKREERLRLKGYDLESGFHEPGLLTHADIFVKGAKYFLDHAQDDVKAAKAAGKRPPKYNISTWHNAINWEPRIADPSNEEESDGTKNFRAQNAETVSSEDAPEVNLP